MKKILVKVFGILLILAGVGLYLYPTICGWMLNWQTKQYMEEFHSRYAEGKETSDTRGSDGSDIPDEASKGNGVSKKDGLYQEILQYNTSIYENGQADFQDAWSYEQSPISLDGLPDEAFGYIEIPSMGVTLPLYIGASSGNMAKGAAVLGQTSIPVGGLNTNSVIAGHRGWRSGSFFLNIEELSVGDPVYITNPWETLTYRAERIDIIDPDDCNAVMIQKGRDMLTLMTCHPYMSQGQSRYIVYCVRDDRNDGDTMEKNTEDPEYVKETKGTGEIISDKDKKYITASDGTVYEASGNSIRTEDLVRKISALAIIVMVLVSFAYTRIQKKKSGES